MKSDSVKDAPLKSKPVPVRLEPADQNFLHAAAHDTGMSVSELLRRSVRLMRRQKELCKSYAFVLDLT
jgi:hypothetical protein